MLGSLYDGGIKLLDLYKLHQLKLKQSCQRKCKRTFLRFYTAGVNRHWESRTILALDPAKLVSKGQPIYDISGFKDAWFGFRTVGGTTGSRVRFTASPLSRDKPFPPNTRGILYYYIDPSLPSVSGGLRFRLCDSLDNFDKGEDLRINTVRRWSVPLIRIVHTNGLQGLVRYLLEEGLVQKRLVLDLKKLPVNDDYFRGRLLYDLCQPFLVDLETTALTFHLITRTSLSTVKIRNPFYNSNKNDSPYTGLAKVRLEFSTFPEHAKKGPTLVLRILDFLVPPRRLSPASSGPFVQPLAHEGFVMRLTHAGRLKPWTYDLNGRRSGTHWIEFLHHLQR